MGLFYLFFVSSCRPLEVLQPYTSIREEKLGDMGDELVHHLEHPACLSCYLIYKDRQKALGVWAKVMAWKAAWYSVRWPIAIVLRFMVIGKQAWLNGLAEETCC